MMQTRLPDAPPLITIVIPVYNMEKYLRECLDSVISQTLCDIEVICVNDGSTDGSRDLLREYEAKDNRIYVIDKANGGVSSARNAAYPSLRGKYTYFVDADDRLDLTLCEKAFYAAEHLQADICFLFIKREGEWSVDPIECPLAVIDPGPDERVFYLTKINGGPYTKLFLTRFLIENAIEFPLYRIGEDQLVHWKASLLAKRVAICPEQLYWYRQNPDSAMRSGGEKCLDIIAVFELIMAFLIKRNLFEVYREIFTAMKLDHLYLETNNLPRRLHALRRQRVNEALGMDELSHLKLDCSPKFFRYYFLAICGDRIAAFQYNVYRLWKCFALKVGLKHLKLLIKESIQRKYDPFQQYREYCAIIAALRREIVLSKMNKREY